MNKKIHISYELKLKVLNLHPSRDFNMILDAMLRYAYDDCGDIQMFTMGALSDEERDKSTKNITSINATITEERYLTDCATYGNQSNKVFLGRFIKNFFEIYEGSEINVFEKVQEEIGEAKRRCKYCRQPMDHEVKYIYLCRTCALLQLGAEKITNKESTE